MGATRFSLLELARLRKVIPRPLTTVLLVLGWGICLAAVTLWAMFQGLLFPTFYGSPPPDVASTENVRLGLYYLGITGVSALSGMVGGEMGKSLGAFFASYILGAIVTCLIMALPAFTGSFSGSGVPLVNASVDLTFRAFFPIPLFLGLVAAVTGALLADKFY